MSLRIVLFFVLTFILGACDTKSKAGPYAELSNAEKARQALDAQDYSRAIDLYKLVITDDPTDYESYRFLSAAYAGAGGFDIFTAIEATLEGATTESGSSPLQALGDFVPSNPTEDQIESLRLAAETIALLPPEYRSYEHPEIETSSSAAQQMEFYQTAYSLITINKFASVTDAGGIDPAKLETMTDQDVDAILGSFENIAAAGNDSVMSSAATEILAQIDAAPGGSRRDKLIDYLNSQGH